MFARLSHNMLILCRTCQEGPRFAPCYIHRFPLIPPPKVDKTWEEYPSYEAIQTVPHRLRWLRHSLGLTQRQVAQEVGVGVTLYVHLEAGECDRISAPVADKLAALYRVPEEDLLYGDNRFL